ncbi:MAG TPA: uracil-DNA glycosylase family protein [Hyphomicrobium sp.]|jgi:uracil-DNA glycosylase|nr:uracil-DNA glycosylase family protein [Hyphomicrobium sp.]
MPKRATVSLASSPASDGDETFDALVSAIRACRICHERPRHGKPMAHVPRPVLQVSETARICIAGQAPGSRVHESGRPFDDPSGVRLRQWLEISDAAFYDSAKVAILPMGFCFPGLGPGGSDLPPRRECAEIWRRRLFSHLPDLELVLVIGSYAQQWHLGREASKQGVNATVQEWRRIYQATPSPRIMPLPHPSWHNNKWLKLNPWFESDLLPVLRADVRRLLS